MMRVATCTCESEFQDLKYGKFKRMFNSMLKNNHWRCTVCGKETVFNPK